MAKVTDLTTLAKTSAASTDFLLVSNSASGQSKKITLESLFPSVSTAGTSSETLYNSATLTNKNQIAFKKHFHSSPPGIDLHQSEHF